MTQLNVVGPVITTIPKFESGTELALLFEKTVSSERW